ncbi:DUF4870 domain-containing protein [Flavobacterium piscinae]|nr:DUF4870 domain-containing protein [Flavobacterium piscinae]
MSAFAKYLIPFAGIVVPLIIWQTKNINQNMLMRMENRLSIFI